MAVLELDYEGVRSALDTSLTEDDLPFETIDQLVFTHPAREWVLARDPDAETYDHADTEYRHAQNAYTCVIAARIAPSLPRILQERAASGSSVQFSREKVDEIVSRLMARASAELAAYLEDSGYPPPPFCFGVASGTRGR
jgi:hypothetical protein